MSVEARTSCTTTCASETDDGDYETSSEGPVRKEIAQNSTDKGVPSTSTSKMESYQENKAEESETKDEESSEKSFSPLDSNVLTKSESMPVLKSVTSLEDTVEDARAVSSESPLARSRKMKMIVAEIDSLLSSRSSPTLATPSDGFKTESTKENYLAKKLESRTVLPVLQDTDRELSNRLKEVTFHELTEDKDFSNQRSRSTEKKRIKSCRLATRDTESQQQENGDLIDIAENPHPSIKSFYFPPNPEKETSSASFRTHSTASRGDPRRSVDELRSMEQQLGEILGMYRALRQTSPSLLGLRHHSTQCTTSSNISGYYLHRTETFGRDLQVNSRQTIDESSQEFRNRGYAGASAFCPIGNHIIPLSHDFHSIKSPTSQIMGVHNEDPRRNSSRYFGKNVSSGTGNWSTGEDDSRVTLNAFHFQFGQFVEKDPSGSLIPSVSSSCYRCHRNRIQTFSHYDDTAGCSSSTRSQVPSAFSKTVDENLMYQTRNFIEKSMIRSEEPGPNLLTDNETKASWTSLMDPGPQVRVTSVNSEPPTDGKSRSHKNSTKNSDNSPHSCQDPSAPGSSMRTASNGNRHSKTQYLNSQTSVVISKKDQDAMISDLEDKAPRSSSQINKKHEHPQCQKKKSVRDLDVQCSGFDLRLHQKQTALGQSMQSILKPSESEESNVSKSSSNKSKSVQVATEEKVVVVPIVFTDGVPEPPKVPMFTVTRSRTHLHNVKCHLVKLKKKVSSLTQSSMILANSIESCETSLNRDDSKSRMSVSCVSRSSLRSRDRSHIANAIKTLSDHHHRSDGKHRQTGSMVSGYTESTKAHSEPTKKRVMYGMRSSPEDFAFNT